MVHMAPKIVPLCVPAVSKAMVSDPSLSNHWPTRRPDGLFAGSVSNEFSAKTSAALKALFQIRTLERAQSKNYIDHGGPFSVERFRAVA